jgi:hypothetical protein
VIPQRSFDSEVLVPRTISASVRSPMKRLLPVVRRLELNRSVEAPVCSVTDLKAVETGMIRRVSLVGFFSRTWIDVSLILRREV